MAGRREKREGSLRAWLARASFAVVLGYQGLALACPVCFSAKDDAQREAFFDTTIFLTLLPLAMIGGIAYWVFQRSLRLAAEEAAETAPAAGAEEAGLPSHSGAPPRTAAASR
jgi:hypothetical protein